jgi:hypothetical protein
MGLCESFRSHNAGENAYFRRFETMDRSAIKEFNTTSKAQIMPPSDAARNSLNYILPPTVAGRVKID